MCGRLLLCEGKKMNQIPLGFEVGTGEPVFIPLHHLVVCGLTRLAGKTTALEALINRAPGIKAIIFRTKRGETGFGGAKPLTPFLVERADWQYVASLLEAAMKEKMRFERSWIIKVTKGTRSLSEVYRNVQEELRRPKLRSLDQSVFTNLGAYLEIILPQLDRWEFSKEMNLQFGLNMMDLEGMSLELQSLVIRSVLERISDQERLSVVVIPEAQDFVPQARNTPVKLAVDNLIRKGGAVGNYVWLDSQTVTGIEKAILKNCDVWLLGRQREFNEAKRTLDQLPIKSKPMPEDIMNLAIGHFYACFGAEVRLVYVQPTWMEAETARQVAMGNVPVPTQTVPSEEDEMYKEEAERLRQELEEARQELKLMQSQGEQVQALERRIKAANMAASEAIHERDILATQLNELADFKRAILLLRDVLGVSGSRQVGDIESLTQAVVERIKADGLLPMGSVQVMLAAPEALKTEYQRQAVEKLGILVQNLTAKQRAILRFLMAVGKASREYLAKKVTGEPDKSFVGQRVSKWHQDHLTPLSNFKLVSWQPQTKEVYYRLPLVVKEELAIFLPTTEEVEAAIANVEHALAEEALISKPAN